MNLSRAERLFGSTPQSLSHVLTVLYMVKGRVAPNGTLSLLPPGAVCTSLTQLAFTSNAEEG